MKRYIKNMVCDRYDTGPVPQINGHAKDSTGQSKNLINYSSNYITSKISNMNNFSSLLTGNLI